MSVCFYCFDCIVYVNKDARKIDQVPVKELAEAGALWIPPEHKDRILRLYGELTFGDFDQPPYEMNKKTGSKFRTCFQTMMHWMNQTGGALQDQYDKLTGDEDYMRDVFNIVQSTVRTRLSEHVWYE